MIINPDRFVDIEKKKKKKNYEIYYKGKRNEAERTTQIFF